jgi:hypothetical protein
MSYLVTLQANADRAAAAEQECRRAFAERISALERERAFAFRRVNLMRAIDAAVAEVPAHEDAQQRQATAIAAALAAMRAKLGWSGDSEAREEVLLAFTPVARAMFLAHATDEIEAPPDVPGALAAFERWYAESRGSPFWALFDQYVPETPVVDF